MSTGAFRTRDVIVVILGGGRGARLDPLTRLRSKPAVPLAGKYRLIDVPISNALHSGMDRMFVLTQFNSVSLHRHIFSTYQFGPFSRGFVEILAAQQTPRDEQWFQGTADAVRQNLRFIAELRGELVLILSGDHIYRMDYRKMLADHLEHEADVTLAVLPCSTEEIGSLGAVRVDSSGRVVEFREKPATEKARAGMEVPADLREAHGVGPDRPFLASMAIYLFRKQALVESLEESLTDFGRDVLPAVVPRRRVQAHFFGGYWRDIGTIRSFYEAHMDLVRPDPPFDFHDPDWMIYTHPRYLPGTRVNGVRMLRSMLAEGAYLQESTVEDSVIGVRSRLIRATVRRTLVMGNDAGAPPPAPGEPPIGIGDGSLIQDAIVDKNARIGRNVRITNKKKVKEAEGEGEGWVIRDGIVVIPKNAVVPDGTTV